MAKLIQQANKLVNAHRVFTNETSTGTEEVETVYVYDGQGQESLQLRKPRWSANAKAYLEANDGFLSKSDTISFVAESIRVGANGKKYANGAVIMACSHGDSVKRETIDAPDGYLDSLVDDAPF